MVGARATCVPVASAWIEATPHGYPSDRSVQSATGGAQARCCCRARCPESVTPGSAPALDPRVGIAERCGIAGGGGPGKESEALTPEGALTPCTLAPPTERR